MTDLNQLRRLPEREVTDRGAINRILDEGFVAHVAYVRDGRPVVLPMLYARDGEQLLVHGSNSMGMARAVREGSPLCATVTLIDAIVVARSAFNSSANYRSVVVHGVGEIVSGKEKERALDLIVEHVLPGRLEDLRVSTESEIAQTSVIAIPLAMASAKARSGDPGDDPADMNSGVWAGVLPLRLVASSPRAAADLESGVETPEYLSNYTR